jgi:NAD(P)H-hydrate epimerase
MKQPTNPTPLHLTRQQVREIDRRAIAQYHVPGIVLMENAARALEAAALQMLGTEQQAVILCGGGNNGGDGLALARLLHNRGVEVELLLTGDPDTYRGDAQINWEIVRAMQLKWQQIDPQRISRRPLIVDAIFGTGLDREPRPPFAQIAAAINASGSPVLAVDLPSGLDCDTGQPLGACVRTTRTVTFVAHKAGFANLQSRPFTGDITVGNIGCPRELIEEVLRDIPTEAGAPGIPGRGRPGSPTK